MTKIEIHKGDLSDEILALADAYAYKPYFYVTAAPEEGLNGLFRTRLRKFTAKCDETGNGAFVIAHDESGGIAGFAGCEKLDFDTGVLKVASGRINYCVVRAENYSDARPVADALVAGCMEWLDKNGIVFTNIRTSALELPLIHALEDFGYNLVDNGFTAIYHRDNVQEYEKAGYDIRLFSGKDLPVVFEILAGAYKFDRFHMDPKISDEAAEELYRVWVHHICMNPKEQEWVLIAERKGVIKGFFQYEYNRELSEAAGFGVFSYGPAAVVRDRTALGAYYSLLSFAISDSIMRGGTYAMTRIPFGIQPILKLTLRLGPSFMSNDLTFHHWK